MDNAARIVVRRSERGYRDRIRSYRIEIDGVRVGKIARGEEAEFPVAPGRRQVRAAIDWTGSPVVQIHVAHGERVELTVESNGGAVKALWQLWSTDSWLTLSVH